MKKARDSGYLPKESIIWICDSCREQGGMTAYIEHCPGCNHRRCEHCVVEVVNSRGAEVSQWSVQPCRQKDHNPRSRRCDGESMLEPAIMPVKTPTSKVFNKGPQLTLPTPTGVRPGAPTSPETAKVVVKLPSPRLSQHSFEVQPLTVSPPCTPTLSPCTSATPPNNFCDTPSDIESSYATTDTESIVTEHSGESMELLWDHIVDILELHFLQAFRRDLELATQLIPRIRLAFYNVMIDLANGGYRTVPQNRTNPIGSQRALVTASSTPNSRSSATSSQRSKRARGSDDDGEQDNNDKSKRSRSKTDASPAADTPVLKFACPFHKAQPEKYHRGTNLRYGPCPSPGWSELRHLKEHLRAVHKPAQCDRCYESFKDIHKLTHHRRTVQCQERSSSYKEGIDDSQWADIDSLIKTRRGLSPDERGQHDIEKWYNMWGIVFGDLRRPQNPYVTDTQVEALPPPLDIVSRMATWDNLVSFEIQHNNLQDGPEVSIYRRLARAFLEATLAIPGLRERFEPLNVQTEEQQQQISGASEDADMSLLPFWEGFEGIENLDNLAQDFYQRPLDQEQTEQIPERSSQFAIPDNNDYLVSSPPIPGIFRSPSFPPMQETYPFLTNDCLLSQPDSAPELHNTLVPPLNNVRHIVRLDSNLSSSTSTSTSSDLPLQEPDNPNNSTYKLSTDDAQDSETLEAMLPGSDIPMRPAMNANVTGKNKHARKAGVQSLGAGGEYINP